jgi:hypothetical protein
MEIKIIYIEYEKKYSNLFERSSSFKNILIFVFRKFIYQNIYLLDQTIMRIIKEYFNKKIFS